MITRHGRGGARGRERRGGARARASTPICEVLGSVTANSAFHGTRLDVDHIGQVMEDVVAQAERARRRAATRSRGETVFVSHETYTPARGGSAAAEIHALRAGVRRPAPTGSSSPTPRASPATRWASASRTSSRSRRSRPASSRRCPNFRDVDPELGELNLSKGGAYPVRYALRLAAGFGSQISHAPAALDAGADGRAPQPGRARLRVPVADRGGLGSVAARMSAARTAAGSRSSSARCASPTGPGRAAAAALAGAVPTPEPQAPAGARAGAGRATARRRSASKPRRARGPGAAQPAAASGPTR